MMSTSPGLHFRHSVRNFGEIEGNIRHLLIRQTGHVKHQAPMNIIRYTKITIPWPLIN